NNNLHALVFAGSVAIGLALIAPIYKAIRGRSLDNYGESFWLTLGFGFVVVVLGWILVSTWWNTLREGHAIFACAMLGFLAVAALLNAGFGLIGNEPHTRKQFALAYLV